MKLRWLLTWAVPVAFLTAATPVLAEPPARFTSDTFRYSSQEERHYGRAALEQLGILGLGSVWYFSNRDANSVDWDLNYDWPSFRQKLDGRAYAFDTNHFETNFLSHPTAGTLYYLAARGNRLSPLVSLSYAVGSSTLWEFVGEFRERVSVNDMIVTPLSGFVLGEALTQLGGFFDRSCDTSGTRVLGSVFGPSKSFHDALDGAVLDRTNSCDAHGFSRIGSHRFGFSLGPRAVWQLKGRTQPFMEMAEELNLAVENLSALGLPGRGFRSFSDGNIAELSAKIAGGSFGWSDFFLAAKVVPVGIHYRDIPWLGEHGESGREAIFGLLLGAEYSSHAYARGAAAADKMFVLDAPAVRLSYRVHPRGKGLVFTLDGGSSFAGVSAFAIDAYERTATLDTLPTIAEARGYNYSAGAHLGPSIRLEGKDLDLSVTARADRFWALKVLDRVREAPGEFIIVEGRRDISARLDFHPARFPISLFATADARNRFGSIGEVRVSRAEVALGAGLGGRL